jgi:outer membrane protein assembly factor BamD
MKQLVTFLCLLLMVWVSACSTVTAPSEVYKNETAREIYQRGKVALQGNNYTEAIKRFEALNVQYPFNEHAESAQLYLLYAYYKKEDYALCVIAADGFIHRYPAGLHVDYAYYIRGLANYYQNLGILERFFSVDLATRDLTQIQKSYHDFATLYRRFPYSRYAGPAHQYMIYLRNFMATHELEVSQYYYERAAYVAAVNRASVVVAHYQGAPAVIKALVLIAKSYHQLGLTKLEQDTLMVIQYNKEKI